MPLFAASSLNNRFTHLLIAVVFLVTAFWVSLNVFDVPRKVSIPYLSPATPHQDEHDSEFVAPTGSHPIDDLIREADTEYHRLLGRATHTLRDAAKAYRARRGRQPPPGFDVWYYFAANNSAVNIEEFFDPIYDDLNPFWGIPAKDIREAANDFILKVYVRNGTTDFRTDEKRIWMDLWSDLVKSIEQYLPDLDIPINVMDESRLIVPSEEIDGYVKAGIASRRIVPARKLKNKFQSLAELDANPPPPYDPQFIRQGNYWELAAAGCPPDSPARHYAAEADFTKLPPLSNKHPKGSYHGYVKNWTFVRQPCEFPELQGLHGTFVEPISMATSKRLFPMFGGSKLPMNNEILIPPAMYWSKDPMYSGGKEHGGPWADKENRIIWRGAASGGRNKKENWARFQRHRFLSMINGTSVKHAEEDDYPPNFVLPQSGQYHLSSFTTPGQSLGDWVDSWSDGAFVHLLCFPGNPDKKKPKECDYTNPYYQVAPSMPMAKQYSYKYLPDIDGNSFSGRYRGFLGSTSLPIKATIYNEWHDSRLIPWRHFVPMDNTFIDIYGIMEYFVGNSNTGVEGHDEQARQIAIAGKRWTEAVLRREDMQIYVLRLLLEYARICDDDREIMGWAESGVG